MSWAPPAPCLPSGPTPAALPARGPRAPDAKLPEGKGCLPSSRPLSGRSSATAWQPSGQVRGRGGPWRCARTCGSWGPVVADGRGRGQAFPQAGSWRPSPALPAPLPHTGGSGWAVTPHSRGSGVPARSSLPEGDQLERGHSSYRAASQAGSALGRPQVATPRNTPTHPGMSPWAIPSTSLIPSEVSAEVCTLHVREAGTPEVQLKWHCQQKPQRSLMAQVWSSESGLGAKL